MTIEKKTAAEKAQEDKDTFCDYFNDIFNSIHKMGGETYGYYQHFYANSPYDTDNILYQGKKMSGNTLTFVYKNQLYTLAKVSNSQHKIHDSLDTYMFLVSTDNSTRKLQILTNLIQS